MIRLKLTDQAIAFGCQNLAIGWHRNNRLGGGQPRGSESAGQNGGIAGTITGPDLQAVARFPQALQQQLIRHQQGPLGGIHAVPAGLKGLAIDHHRDDLARLKACR